MGPSWVKGQCYQQPSSGAEVTAASCSSSQWRLCPTVSTVASTGSCCLCACKRTTDPAAGGWEAERRHGSADHRHHAAPPPPSHPHAHHQTFRLHSLKKSLAIVDSRNVTVRELRVMSVTVTSPGPITGLQISAPDTSAARTWSDLMVAHQSSVFSCPERGRGGAKREKGSNSTRLCCSVFNRETVHMTPPDLKDSWSSSPSSSESRLSLSSSSPPQSSCAGLGGCELRHLNCTLAFLWACSGSDSCLQSSYS